MMTDQRRQIGRRPASSTRQRFAHGRPLICHFSPFTFYTLLVLGTAATAQFCYVANGGGSNNVSGYQIESAANISTYRIARSGALTPVPGSPFATGREPYSIAVNAANQCAYVANRFDKNISAYAVAANGALTPIEGSPFPAGVGPDSVACTR
jgi:6-phosphogluconolactonase